MQIAFSEQGKTELGVMKEELGLVGLRKEDHQQMSVRKQRNKPGKMREFVTLLRADLGLA